ncbi:2-dehydropantoate 2-reductase [Candidatus Electrothrix aarhusensis]|uniref:2-dehydropantoate 2-reductase n=1 Tax=Candidatus Electrothrix aarhusensis TaxID=1859131 RepID=A0A3S3QYC8_9BACT|nr:2-dehydropantoate 2-reductase [Candidatus Electrothrix aarhusensis]
MRTLIYGGGAVGLGLAGCLLKMKEEVDILARENTRTSLQEKGLRQTGIFGEYHADPQEFGCFSCSDDLSGEPYDYILVCTKSFDSPAVAQDIADHSSLLHEQSVIILVQNGWGNADIFVEHLPAERIFNARVITGFCRPQSNQVEITAHVQPIHIGSLFGAGLVPIEKLCETINQGGIPCEAAPDIARDLWAKMLFNCALNPLGAIFNVPYGALAEQENSRRIMDEVIHEVFRVMEAAGYSTHWASAADYMEAFYGTIVPLAAKHCSSTLQDIQAEKKTEIDALCGAVIRLGKEQGIAVPCNEMLYNVIRFMERR